MFATAAAVMILILTKAIADAPTAWASCSPSPDQVAYVNMMKSRGMVPGPLPSQEARYVELLASRGLGSTTGDMCFLRQSAYSILVLTGRSEMTLDQIVKEISRQSGLGHDQATWVMNSAFNAFGFPPTCDLAPNKTC